MKKIFATAIAACLMTAAVAQQNIKSIEIGSAMPMENLKLVSVTDDKAYSLNDLKGENGLLVMFSCNTCPYVVKAQERTKEMMAYAKGMGFGVVSVNSNEAKRDGDDSPKAMAKYADKQNYFAPYLIDLHSAMADAFGATRTPEVFLFDNNGNLMYKGAMEDNPVNPEESEVMYLRDAIDMVSQGMVPDPNSTKSIGCSIKRAS